LPLPAPVDWSVPLLEHPTNIKAALAEQNATGSMSRVLRFIANRAFHLARNGTARRADTVSCLELDATPEIILVDNSNVAFERTRRPSFMDAIHFCSPMRSGDGRRAREMSRIALQLTIQAMQLHPESSFLLRLRLFLAALT
jgi:hypothetical protein